MFEKFYKLISNDIGIDLGTSNTLVYLKGHGIVVNEPSVVAVNMKTSQILAVGTKAKEMLGRTPGHIKAIRPLVDGVISDFEVTEEMLSYLINKADKISKKFARPRVLIGVPTGTTNVETRAVYDAARSAGAREVFLVEEPMAAAIGIRLPIKDPVGSMIIDIGGGTTDIAVISLGGVVKSKNLKIAGDRLNNDIITYMRDEFKILIGERTAEMIKISIGSVLPGEYMETEVHGRDLLTGLPRAVVVTDSDIREAITPSVRGLVEGVKDMLETTPPEILSDIMHRGITLSGGGALIPGLDQLLQRVLKIPVYVVEDPLSAVARGTGVILDNIPFYKEVLIVNQDKIMMSNYNSILIENINLKEILGRKNEKTAMILAAVLSKPNQSPYDTIIIDAGTKQGLKTGDVIFALGNIPIGRVSNVYPNSSKVILFSNSGEKMQVVISGKDVFMEVVGRGGGNFEMILPRDFILVKGDQVVLPGITSYVLGIVETIISDPRDPFVKALLVSPANIQELKFVQVELQK